METGKVEMARPYRLFAGLILILLTSCLSPQPTMLPTLGPLPATLVVPSIPPTSAITNFEVTPEPSQTAAALVPDFEHIVVVVFENKEYGTVIRNPKMPYFNILANTFTLLNQHYAVTHPSLPNYIAMIAGDTHGITSNCEDCFIDQPSLPDLIEASGRTWKTYQESMPEPCFIGSTALYVQKHNPFIYFDPVRLNPDRCAESIVPLGQLDVDIAQAQLPNFIFITPNLCHDAHDCGLDQADPWLDSLMDKLIPALDSTDEPYLVVLTWDEGQGDLGCCGLPEDAGGRIATILISPQVKNGFQDETPYTHYSLLKTISASWGLPYLGHTADENNVLMIAPWK
jgi:hypothetical protein